MLIIIEPGFNRSLSEDKHLAEAQLGNDSYDVLQRHHDQNRAPLPPDPQQLKKVRSCHGNVTERKGDHSTKQRPEPSSGNSEPNTRLRRHSQKPYLGRSDSPKKLGFYPPQWRDVLYKAMNKWRLWIALVCGFPDGRNENHRKKVMSCIIDALAEHQKNGGRVEKSKSVHHLDRATVCLIDHGYARDLAGVSE